MSYDKDLRSTLTFPGTGCHTVRYDEGQIGSAGPCSRAWMIVFFLGGNRAINVQWKRDCGAFGSLWSSSNPSPHHEFLVRRSAVDLGRGPAEFLLVMTILITVIHIVVCLFLIAVVLLQSGKSGDIAAAFGGQGSQTAFGPRGAASALSRATTWSAIIFMVTSITLSIYASRKSGPSSVLSGTKSSQSQPAKPAAPPATPTQK
jgi:preprotein translocase subunit SecG